ncbi:hypothetical protein GCM10023200_05560 [Actinomycetospora chlora]|uniref:DUF1080 domain-containing protein n=1 Tax=Actinomycetospora chlora TaxID=663608 RepID=A0ABP9A9F5_9PSEU
MVAVAMTRARWRPGHDSGRALRSARSWWRVTAWSGLVLTLAGLTVWLATHGTRGAELANVLALPVAVVGVVLAVVAGRAASTAQAPVSTESAPEPASTEGVVSAPGPTESAVAAPDREPQLLYDGARDDPAYKRWTLFATGGIQDEDRQFPHDGDALGMRSVGRDVVGLNLSLPTRKGLVTFEYRVTDGEYREQVYFAVIPMQENGLDGRGLIEVGRPVQDHPDNARSPYRSRDFVPRRHFDDREWHEKSITFDFTPIEGAFYAIFAPRINEGLDRAADATVHVRRVRAWSITR